MQRYIFIEKKLFKEKRGVEEWRKKPKEVFLTAPFTMIKKESTISIRKYANESKVNEKIVRTTIK